ncbi:tctex1 domain-containing protein 2-like [Chelonus insularis]|uniref:tctex1 domain-containing protein 2-like n=1 Tax=Chelonus insularis TaxID=460826 RepID=UPI00158BF019|nr:tctex1 domain-containing protein 2-like [Chelonus insularis]XP_034942498.1 tctex1 domain-containing protein 2-like [Chelonus insularis]
MTDADNKVLSEGDDNLQANYQIRPQLTEKFRPQVVKELIHNVLHDELSLKVYNVNDAKTWTKTIADVIRDKVKELQLKDYKYVVNVVLGEQKGEGVKVGNRCLWDAEADNYAHADFINETLFCVACVYAVFYY